MTRDFISEQTDFDNGPLFETPAQVRAYFTPETMCSIYGAHCDPYPDILTEMADTVIANRWHCADCFLCEFLECSPKDVPDALKAELGGCKSIQPAYAIKHKITGDIEQVYKITVREPFTCLVAIAEWSDGSPLLIWNDGTEQWDIHMYYHHRQIPCRECDQLFYPRRAGHVYHDKKCAARVHMRKMRRLRTSQK